MALPTPTIDLLLTLIDTRPRAILDTLAQHPHLASACDAHGYSLAHAAASYHELVVLRTLVQTYNVDINLRDEDGETPLFAAESLEVAQCLVQELGADPDARNAEGKTAEVKIAEEEGHSHPVCKYLRELRGADATLPPKPALPDGLKVNMTTMEEDDAGDAPDPEIRRRIEELAARPDYQSDEVQQQLRELVHEVVSGINSGSGDGSEEQGPSVRRRVD